MPDDWDAVITLLLIKTKILSNINNHYFLASFLASSKLIKYGSLVLNSKSQKGEETPNVSKFDKCLSEPKPWNEEGSGERLQKFSKRY